MKSIHTAAFDNIGSLAAGGLVITRVTGDFFIWHRFCNLWYFMGTMCLTKILRHDISILIGNGWKHTYQLMEFFVQCITKVMHALYRVWLCLGIVHLNQYLSRLLHLLMDKYAISTLPEILPQGSVVIGPQTLFSMLKHICTSDISSSVIFHSYIYIYRSMYV